jgi:hypothetical protein
MLQEDKIVGQKAESYAKKWWGHLDIKPIQLSYMAGYQQCSNDKQLEIEELKATNEKWIEKYNADYDRVVSLIKDGKPKDHMITVQDTVIAIGKLMDMNADLELSLKNL